MTAILVCTDTTSTTFKRALNLRRMGDIMNIIKAESRDCKFVYDIVQNTIEAIYPYYYPKEVVNFFSDYHNEVNIRNDIEKGNVYLLSENGRFAATGSLDGRIIGRLYVLPEYQGKGYGSSIMKQLECIASRNYSTSMIEASLPSYDYYLKQGYHPTSYHKYPVDNNRVLCYYEMEKELTDLNTLHLGSTYLIVKDFEKSMHFYEKLLRMKVSAQNFNRWAQFNFDGKCIALYNCEYDAKMIESRRNLELHYNQAYITYSTERKIHYGNHMVLNFWVNNLNTEYDRLKALDIGKVSEILYVNIKAPYYFFVIDDPDGNTIEITGNYIQA
jgi:lactoylglutathione lyase